MAETQIKTALQSNIWCSVLVPFSSMSCFIGQDHDYSINIVVRERARASRVVNFFEFNQCTPSWLAGCTWHSLACIDSSPFMKKLPRNALVRTFRNTLCCWNNQQIQVSPRNQKQHFPLTACQATVTTNSLRTYSSVFIEWYYILRQDDLSLEPLDVQSIKCFSHRTRFGVLLVHVWSCQIIRWQIIDRLLLVISRVVPLAS